MKPRPLLHPGLVLLVEADRDIFQIPCGSGAPSPHEVPIATLVTPPVPLCHPGRLPFTGDYRDYGPGYPNIYEHCGLPGEVALLRLRLHPGPTPYQPHSTVRDRSRVEFNSQRMLTLCDLGRREAQFPQKRVYLTGRAVPDPVNGRI